MNVKLAELLSRSGGKLPKYVTSELYPVYYITVQGVTLCPYCANLILKGQSPFGAKIKADDLDEYKINWDNYDLRCERGHKIDSATLELELPSNEGDNNDSYKRQIPNKIGHIKLYSHGEQTSTR